jgi:hypothetical protein
MVPEGSFSYSLQLATKPYPEPDESKPYSLRSLLLLLLRCYLHEVLPSNFLSYDLLIKNCYGIALSLMCATCSVHLMPVDSIILIIFGGGIRTNFM